MFRKHVLMSLSLLLLSSLLAIAARPVPSRASSACKIGSKLAPSCGAYWGAASSGGWSTFQSLIGRKLAIVHDYAAWTETFPSAAEIAAVKQGSLLLVDWGLHSTGVSWSQIASGAQDQEIDAEATALKAFGKPIMVSFQSEPDRTTDQGYGTPSQFVAAWRHIHQVFAAEGVRNVIWAWDVTGYTAHPLQSFYPGDAYVDWIMWDPYNWYGCKGGTKSWESFSQIVSPMYDWLTQHSGKRGYGNYLAKPWGLGEYGTVEGPNASSKARWIEGAVSQLPSFPRLKALVYFNGDDVLNGRTCTWDVNTSQNSLTGFRNAGDVSRVGLMPFPNDSATLR